MNCQACHGKGAVMFRFRDNAPHAIGLCQCREGKRQRVTLLKHPEFLQHHYRTPMDQIVWIEDIADESDIRAWFGQRSGTTDTDGGGSHLAAGRTRRARL